MLKKTYKYGLILLFIVFFAFALRIYKISSNPTSLFGDELDLGYQAYSILKTGKDYQGNFMPLNFHSIAEYRTPLYLYSAVPTVALFGITPLGVRLPAIFFGVLGVYSIYLLTKEIFGKEKLAILSAALLSISPWHLQYSRAGFEVTEMLFFLLVGLYFFLKSLRKSSYLWVSALFLTLTPWIYSTAKFFTPFFLLTVFIIWRRQILLMERKHLIKAIISGLLIGLPLAYSIFFGGATQRFNYISIFSDPTTESEVGASRSEDSYARGENKLGTSPKLIDRLVHNKFTFWGDGILRNYLMSFSTEFLFKSGDPDPRQSVGTGEMYFFEIIFVLFGLAFLVMDKTLESKKKVFLLAWLLLAPVSSSLTRDGGNHATRLILLLPPLVILCSYGLFNILEVLSTKNIHFVRYAVFAIYSVSFMFYLHLYYVHYPSASERWWHYGWTPAIKQIKSIDSNYDRVIISMSGEPAWIFFAGNYQYDPDEWQKNFPIGNDETLEGFGKISHVGKFYFGSPQSDVQIYGLGRVIDKKTLYLANAKEVGENLIMHPEKSPQGLELISKFAYPSGEPAFYLFSGVK